MIRYFYSTIEASLCDVTSAGIVVRKERPDLEEQKDSLVLNIAAGKKKIKELEDEILRYLPGDPPTPPLPLPPHHPIFTYQYSSIFSCYM